MYSKGPGLRIIGVLPVLQSSIPLLLYNTRSRAFFFCSAVRSHRIFLISISSASSSNWNMYITFFMVYILLSLWYSRGVDFAVGDAFSFRY